MEWMKKITDFVGKFRYVILVAVIGLILMLIPTRSGTGSETKQTEPTVTARQDVAQELTQILSQLQGAGKVKVMLTVREGETTEYQIDEDITNGENGSVRQDTVIVTDGSRNQQGLIRQVNPPQYLGAIVLCEGADSAAVRLSIIEAVSKVTGLGTDKISVLKMK